MVLISYDEVVGRCLIKVREDHYSNFHADFAQVLLQKVGSRREQALHQSAMDKGNVDKANAILQKMADGLPWTVTICKMGGLGGEPLDFLKAKTEEDTGGPGDEGTDEGTWKGQRRR